MNDYNHLPADVQAYHASLRRSFNTIRAVRALAAGMVITASVALSLVLLDSLLRFWWQS